MTASGPGKTGFRAFKVTGKVRESAIITSFHLEPADADGWLDFRPGQFLALRIPAGGGADPVLRTYSLSGPPGMPGRYRITVKREPPAAAGLPAGLASSYLHDHVGVGDTLMAQGPRGDFVLDATSTRPVVLLSGGVGLTPMVAMLHALAPQASRRVCFLHACENGDVHALRDEVAALCATRPGLTAHVCYRAPTAQDRAAPRHQSEGLVTTALLQQLLCLDDYDFYLCGPPPFMAAVYGQLRGFGVPKARIAYEFFGPATVLEAPAAPAAFSPVAAPAPTAEPGAATVTFRKSGRVLPWNPAAESLLSFAEDSGLSPEFSCRAGVCGTCRAGLLSGDVRYFEEPLDAVPAGSVLLCCARPDGAVVLDL